MCPSFLKRETFFYKPLMYFILLRSFSAKQFPLQHTDSLDLSDNMFYSTDNLRIKMRGRDGG